MCQMDSLAGFMCNLHGLAEQCKRHEPRKTVCPSVSCGPDTYLVPKLCTRELMQRCT